jgi:hypothetical protein
MGSSRRFQIPKPPTPNPNAMGVGASNSTYNVPVVSPYETQNYQPFFTQQAANSVAGQPQSYFNTYGSFGQAPDQVPYNATGGGISSNVHRFAQSAPLTGFGIGGF